MRIAVMGSGGIGGYFGGRLAAAGSNDVWFIARGAQLEAIRKNGLTILGEQGETCVSPIQATNDPREVGPVDIIIFAVKLYDVDEAAELCRPMVADHTAVISLQNGIGSEERVDTILGAGHGVGGIAYAPVSIQSPGVIRHEGGFARLVFGEMTGTASPRLSEFQAACVDAGFDATQSDQIKTELWDKFVFLASYAGITCLTRQPCRILQEDMVALDLFRMALHEAVAVAQSQEIALDPDIVDRVLGMLPTMPANGQSSMLTDLKNGKPLENSWFSGKIVELGRAQNIPTPVHHAFYAAMRPFENGTVQLAS